MSQTGVLALVRGHVCRGLRDAGFEVFAEDVATGEAEFRRRFVRSLHLTPQSLRDLMWMRAERRGVPVVAQFLVPADGGRFVGRRQVASALARARQVESSRHVLVVAGAGVSREAQELLFELAQAGAEEVVVVHEDDAHARVPRLVFR